MQHLYFIRHGESVMNNEGIFSGRSETPLNATGRAQSRDAGQSLKDIPIHCIVTSPMGRTIETAELIADMIGFPKKKIITNHLFTERDFGPLEGAHYEPNLGDIDGVEPIADMIARAEQGLAFLRSLRADTVLLVSHGAIGRALRHCIDPQTPYRPSKGFENGKVVKLF
jgi:uncharacterized phosphatase